MFEADGGQEVVVESEEVAKILSVFSPVLQKICQGADVIEEALITVDSFNLWLSANTVITYYY